MDKPPHLAVQLWSLTVESTAEEPPSKYTRGTLGGFALSLAMTWKMCVQRASLCGRRAD